MTFLETNLQLSVNLDETGHSDVPFDQVCASSKPKVPTAAKKKNTHCWRAAMSSISKQKLISGGSMTQPIRLSGFFFHSFSFLLPCAVQTAAIWRLGILIHSCIQRDLPLLIPKQFKCKPSHFPGSFVRTIQMKRNPSQVPNYWFCHIVCATFA